MAGDVGLGQRALSWQLLHNVFAKRPQSPQTGPEFAQFGCEVPTPRKTNGSHARCALVPCWGALCQGALFVVWRRV